MQALRLLCFTAPLASLLFSCTGTDAPRTPAADTTSSAAVDTTPPPPPEVNITYTAFPLKDTGIKAFKQIYNTDEQRIIYAINRIDAGHLRGKDTLVVPDTFLQDFLQYSPFPQELPRAKDVRKLVLFSYPIQAFAAYEGGRLIRWGPTSMGKKSTPTPTGLFFANWKARETRSTVDPSWILKWNFNISNKGGVGWHQYAMPGYPASHSCLRLPEVDARWLYDWADMWVVDHQADQLQAQGTPTIVFGQYPWGQPRPWMALLTDPKANQVPADTLNALLDQHLDRILEKQKQREQVVQSRGGQAPQQGAVQNTAPMEP